MKSCFVVVSAILFIPCALVGLFLFNLNKTLLTPDFYKEGLKKTNAYEEMLKVDPEIIYEDLFAQGANQALKEKGGTPIESPEDVRVMTNSISPETLKFVVEAAIDDFFAHIKNPEKETVTLKLLPLKEEMLQAKLSPKVKIMVESIPDEYEITTPGLFVGLKIILNWLPILIATSAILAILFLLLAVLLKKGIKGRFRLLALLFFILFLFLAPFAFGALLPISTIKEPAGLQALIEILSGMKNEFFNLFLYEAAVFGGLAVLLFIVSFFFERNKNLKPQTIKP